MAMFRPLYGTAQRRSLAFAATVLVLAGICPDTHAAGDYGLLRLQLGAANQFVYQEDGNSSPIYFQPFYAPGKGSCLLAWTAGYPRLAELEPGGGALADEPGFGPTSIGVYDGAKGTPCSRVSTYATESLTFSLGGYTTSTTGLGANAFDRLELDIEVKQNARLLLTMYVAGSISRKYELRTGSSIVPGVGLDPAPDGTSREADPSNRIVNCSARSDSGPDSGSSDNCRWIINDLGQTFKVEPLVGEFSLEGGGDWLDAYENNSLIYLTYVVEGDLACGQSTPTIDIGDGLNGEACVVAGPPAPELGSCPATIHYVFRDIAGSQKGCEFIKPSGSQLAASMKITFPAEPRTALNSVPSTTVLFPDGYGGTVAFAPGLCTGTVGGTADNPTILEVLTATPPPGYVDVVPGNAVKDWACILEQKVEYQGPLMQVSQIVVFWGDPAIIRQ